MLLPGRAEDRPARGRRPQEFKPPPGICSALNEISADEHSIRPHSIHGLKYGLIGMVVKIRNESEQYCFCFHRASFKPCIDLPLYKFDTECLSFHAKSAQPFTAPSVAPFIKKRWQRMNSTTTGTVANSATASWAALFPGIVCAYIEMPIGSVLSFLLEIITNCQR